MTELFNTDTGLKKSDIGKMTYRNKFSTFLPYRAYDPNVRAYYNVDETIGFIWECLPLVYADESVFQTLSGLINTSMPEGSTLQFILFADPHIKRITDRFTELKTRRTELSEKAMKNTIGFFQNGTRGMKKMRGIPVRNFRLIVSLKMPVRKDKETSFYLDIRDSVYETLSGIYLSPSEMSPASLINTLAKIFNDADTIPEFMGVRLFYNGSPATLTSYCLINSSLVTITMFSTIACAISIRSNGSL